MLTPYDETELRLIYVVLVLLTAMVTTALLTYTDLRRYERPGHRPAAWWLSHLRRRLNVLTLCATVLATAWAAAWALS